MIPIIALPTVNDRNLEIQAIMPLPTIQAGLMPFRLLPLPLLPAIPSIPRTNHPLNLMINAIVQLPDLLEVVERILLEFFMGKGPSVSLAVEFDQNLVL